MKYKIELGTQAFEWIDNFDDEEEATTYALRNGCKVEGC